MSDAAKVSMNRFKIGSGSRRAFFGLSKSRWNAFHGVAVAAEGTTGDETRIKNGDNVPSQFPGERRVTR
ncbi:MAG: hypothetical protein R3174_08505 [Gammaproteobacteria bacterium]|nr:hypothetical protein [Gammaproteobacteria bacterium]